jgi:tetratricopeptide (TPR) repeat protein
MLRADLREHAVPLTRLVPAVRERLPDVPEAAPLPPNEEQMRLLDAVAQGLLGLAARAPTVLVLDDLHWADAGTVALLLHVARFAPRARLLLLGAYRDVEVPPHHPLTEVLSTLPREPSYELLALRGLDATAVHSLAEAVTKRSVTPAWAETLTRETNGNPFFLRELLLDLVEEGALGREDANAPPAVEKLRLPDTVRQVIARRLARLPAAARGLLRVAAAFTGGIDFEVARRVAGLDEQPALDALDVALAARLLVLPSGAATACDFTHALVRHTLYEALNPARQVRLHREIAEMMEAVYGDRTVEHAAEIARHYHRSASLPGAERGVPHCLEAADRAERAIAFADVAEHLSAALDLLPPAAPGRSRILARRGLALMYARRFDDAIGVVREAAACIADDEGRNEAARYLAKVCSDANSVGGIAAVPIDALLRLGLQYCGERRDITWAILQELLIQREPDALGIPQDTPERREIAAIFEEAGIKVLPDGRYVPVPWTSRAEIMTTHPTPSRLIVVGDYRGLRPYFQREIDNSERQGQVAKALYVLSSISKFHTALGDFAESRKASRRASELAGRSVEPSQSTAQLVIAEDDWCVAMDEGWDHPMENVGPGLGDGPVLARYRAIIHAASARTDARMGRIPQALRMLESLLPALEKAPAWAENYVRLACDLAETLWLAERTDHIEIIERNLREKVVAPDFRYPMRDGRLALACLCALQHRYDETSEWFAKARVVLDGQGARPLRAIVDYDEALMYARRAALGDRERAAPLVDAALVQFRALGMPGWIRRAEALQAKCGVPGAAMSIDELAAATAPALRSEPRDGVFHRDGEYWTLAYAGRIIRLRDTKGLQYIAHLLASPGREIHVADLVALDADAHGDGGEIPPSLVQGNLGSVLDRRARADYKERLDELRDDLEEATRGGDLGRAARARHEIEEITRQLTAAYGLGGRPRTTGDPAERWRKAATNQIRRTLERIRGGHPDLGRHLENALRTGIFCSYVPERPITWRL